MQTVDAKPLSRYPWYIRLFFWKQKRTYGQVLVPGQIWGRSPKVFATLALLYGAFNRRSSPLSPPLRSLGACPCKTDQLVFIGVQGFGGQSRSV